MIQGMTGSRIQGKVELFEATDERPSVDSERKYTRQ
jgi:hypothetical protein